MALPTIELGWGHASCLFLSVYLLYAYLLRAHCFARICYLSVVQWITIRLPSGWGVGTAVMRLCRAQGCKAAAEPAYPIS